MTARTTLSQVSLPGLPTAAAHASSREYADALAHPWPSDHTLYGDALSSMPRRSGTNMSTLDGGYYTMSVVIAPKSFAATKIRFYVAQAGVTGGSPAVALRLYTGGAPPYSVAASPALTASNLTSVGIKELALGTTVNVTQGQRYAFLSYIPAASFTTSPGLAFSAIYYSGLNNPSSFIYNGYKTAAAAPPTTISPSDGTWTGNPSTLWWALAA